MSKQMPTAVPSPQEAKIALETEFAQVNTEIQTALSDLFPPFSQMIEAQMRSGGPMKRAAVVLTAGVGAPDTPELRTKRIFLAAALEMLHLALAVHMALGDSQSTDSPQYHSLLGSTILAGDFCFSRSAGLAVRTGDPVVVEIFSDALKQVSEGNLRRFLDATPQYFDEDRALYKAGIAAAGQLTGLSTAVQSVHNELVSQIANVQPGQADPRLLAETAGFKSLSAFHQVRWSALLAWFCEN